MWDVINIAGNVLWWAILPAFLLYKGKNDKFGKYIMALGFGAFLAMALKYLFLIPRDLGIGPAFPSLHAQTAFLAALLFSRDCPRARLPLLAFAVLASAARIGLGYHTPVDVVAGMFLGTVLAFAFANLSVPHVNWNELSRQILHFLGIVLIPVSYYAGNYVTAVALLPVAGFVLWSQSSPFTTWTRMFKRESEKDYRSAFLFVLSLAGTLIIFPWAISAPAIAILCAGDSFSAAIGTHFRAHPWWFNKKKSVEGTLAFVVAAYPAAFFFLGREVAVVAVLLGALVEALPLNDNIGIPAAVGAFLSIARIA
jgi:dolichol kinase